MATTAAPAVTARVMATGPTRSKVTIKGRRLATRLSSAAIAFLFGLLVLTGAAVPAQALDVDIPVIGGAVDKATCPFGNEDSAADTYSGEMYRSGIDSLTPVFNPIAGKISDFMPLGPEASLAKTNITAYEYYGTSGLTFSRANAKGDGCWGGGASAMAATSMANTIFDVTKASVSISIAMYQWAASPDLMADFATPIDKVVKGLKQNLYLNFLTPVIVLGALWGAWQGLVKKRTTETTQGAMWMVGSAVFALVFMSWPSAIANGANHVVSTVNSVAMTAVTGATSQAIPEDDMCYLPTSGRTSERAPSPADKKKVQSAGVRMASCSLYKALLYTPWAAGQFGVPAGQPLRADAGNDDNKFSDASPYIYSVVKIPGHEPRNDLRLAQLEAQATNQVEASLGTKQARLDAKKADTARWKKIQERAYTEPWVQTWTGLQPTSRVNVAMASVLASTSAGVMILVISFSSIVLALGMLMLILMSPLFLLIGAHPGFGRGIALKWLELLIGTVVKRIVLGFMLAVLIGFYQVILATPMSWFSQVALIMAIGIGALIYRKPLLETMNIVNLGGTRTGLEEGGFGRQAKKGTAASIGAVSGAVSGAQGAGAMGFLGGMVSGATMGARSGNPLRAGQMGAGAGRRVAARKNAAAEREKRRDENEHSPFVADRARRKETKEVNDLQRLADTYADDPEMLRKIERWAEKNDMAVPVPRPRKGVPAGGDRPPADPNVPAVPPVPAEHDQRIPQGAAPAPAGATPRPQAPQPAGPAAAPTSGPAASAGAPLPTGPAPAPSAPAAPRPGDVIDRGSLADLEHEVRTTRRAVQDVGTAQVDQGRALDELQAQRGTPAPPVNDDLARRMLAQQKQIAERNGARPSGPPRPNGGQ